jgi:hypothetical protein
VCIDKSSSSNTSAVVANASCWPRQHLAAATAAVATGDALLDSGGGLCKYKQVSSVSASV